MIFRGTLCLSAVLIAGAFSAVAAPIGTSPGPSARYATDAYPGFDNESEIIKPSRKEPKWLSWLNGPKRETPAEQLAYALNCQANGSWRSARRGFDALVREWPTSPEAPVAQKALADLYLVHELDYEQAFAEYRYLLDFHSSSCDYDAVAELMFKCAELMREEGKRVVFFRFANTVDVRRAYEALVLRAPGARFAPGAMLTIAALREDEGRYETAVTVYENLRSLHPETPEARAAWHLESGARMKVIRECEYNRDRVKDTIAFLKSALASNALDAAARDEVTLWLAEAERLLEDEAYQAAVFYDSRTRTRRSAVNAYMRFLSDYPESAHAPEIRRRLAELQKEGE